MTTENNRGIKCPTGCSIVGPDEVDSVGDSDSEIERRLETRGQFKIQTTVRDSLSRKSSVCELLL
jgi:hypothetical protein